MTSTNGKATHLADAPVDNSVDKDRPSSYTRFKAPLRTGVSGGEGLGPSTLPPPPFESEAEVRGLDWWLTAQMDLASELLWLEQLLDGMPDGGPHVTHVGTMRRLVSHVEAVRDALYELYCDAADERMAPLLGPEAPFESYVRLSYAWCTCVVGVLAAITSGLRTRGDAGPDWAAAKAGFRRAEQLYPRARGDGRVHDDIHVALRGLGIDFGSPVEPLRNLPHDLEQLSISIEEARTTLAKRFG
jgi:hypothetical protein